MKHNGIYEQTKSESSALRLEVRPLSGYVRGFAGKLYQIKNGAKYLAFSKATRNIIPWCLIVALEANEFRIQKVIKSTQAITKCKMT